MVLLRVTVTGRSRAATSNVPSPSWSRVLTANTWPCRWTMLSASELVLAKLRLHGWPEGVLGLARHDWCDQLRWLVLGRAVVQRPELVASSLPQGDPLSTLGLVVALNDAVLDVASLGVGQCVFLDDRFLTVPCLGRVTFGPFGRRGLGLLTTPLRLVSSFMMAGRGLPVRGGAIGGIKLSTRSAFLVSIT